MLQLVVALSFRPFPPSPNILGMALTHLCPSACLSRAGASSVLNEDRLALSASTGKWAACALYEVNVRLVLTSRNGVCELLVIDLKDLV